MGWWIPSIAKKQKQKNNLNSVVLPSNPLIILKSRKRIFKAIIKKNVTKLRVEITLHFKYVGEICFQIILNL